MKMVIGALLGATMFCAQAQAACWSPREVAAAQIRSLDTMMMVSALGCRGWDRSVAARYNAFVEQNRGTLREANEVIRGHFAGQFGRVSGEEAYDAYVTQIANRFGGGHQGFDCGDFAQVVDDALATNGSFAELTAIADRARVEPSLDDGVCDRSGAAW